MAAQATRIETPVGRALTPGEISAGELMALDYGIRRDVEALEESAFLITISWPGGTAEERHAEQNTAP